MRAPFSRTAQTAAAVGLIALYALWAYAIILGAMWAIELLFG